MSNNRVGRIVGVNGNMVVVEFDDYVVQNEVAFVKYRDERLKSEVIRVRGSRAELQVYEDTKGLRLGDKVEFTDQLLSVELGPGLLGQIFDGLQNPLPQLAEECGFFLKRGVYLEALPDEAEWEFNPFVKKGDRVKAGGKLGFVYEKIFKHWIMAPFYLDGELKVDSIVDKGKYKAVFLTIKIPSSAEPGSYKGTITIQTEKGSQSLPLHLIVYPLTLPDERHLMVTEWYSTGGFQQYHGIDFPRPEQFYKMLKVYAENMAEHRQNVFRVSLGLIESSQDANGKLEFDFSRFDEWADIFWDTGRMDLLETGFIARFGEGGWSSREILLRDFRVRNKSTNN